MHRYRGDEGRERQATQRRSSMPRSLGSQLGCGGAMADLSEDLESWLRTWPLCRWGTRRPITRARMRDRWLRPRQWPVGDLSLIHISEPTRQAEISYAVF